MPQKSSKDYVLLHSMVIVLGFTAVLGKLISTPALEVVIYRTFLTAMVFFAILLFKRKSFRPGNSLPIISVGAILGLHWICFFGSAKMSTVSISLATFSTTAFFTSILEPLSQRRKIEIFDILLGLVVIIGISIIFSAVPQHFWAVTVGILAGFLASVYSVANAHLIKKYDSISLNTLELSGAFLICLVLFPFFQSFDQWKAPRMQDLVLLLILAVVCTVIPYIVNLNLLKKFTAFEMNLAVNMEPVYGILIGWLVFKEEEALNASFYIGASLVLLTLLAYANKKALTKWTGL
ncbi:DMT family transporter [Jiulongibacter sp. NS-SX5]|uniref:DMT family transporter n=1 Tax=Jiulongibacter sp. NS-SX5 TaxID=3463854 RepID=UPI004057EA1B